MTHERSPEGDIAPERCLFECQRASRQSPEPLPGYSVAMLDPEGNEFGVPCGSPMSAGGCEMFTAAPDRPPGWAPASGTG